MGTQHPGRGLRRGIGPPARRALDPHDHHGLRRSLRLRLSGALILLAQLGIGDPAQGVSYTLNSIAAVVLGGTSLLGGRGTFIGTLLGAGLTVQLLNATTFLSLSQTWQYLFQGALIVIAALVYSQARGTGRKAEGITR